MIAMTTHEMIGIERAQALHRRAIVVDTHVDTTQRLGDENFDLSTRHAAGHLDIPRLRDGGVDAVFFAVWASGPVEPGVGVAAAREQIQWINRTVEKHAGDLVLARTANDIRQAHESGRMALLIAIEGGYLIEDSLDILREYAAAGAAYLTLTHAFHIGWADSSGVHIPLKPKHGGLTEFGREVVCELNRLGMMVDISHVSDRTFWDVVETSKAPLIATHSSCRSVSPHCRNLSDDMMRAIAKTGGVVQMNFCAAFIDPNHPPLDRALVDAFFNEGLPGDRRITDYETSLSVLVDHFDHALQTIGPDHVGFGSDFDGVPCLPVGMEDCSKLPALTSALFDRGYSEADLEKMLGANVLRVMDGCRSVAQSIA